MELLRSEMMRFVPQSEPLAQMTVHSCDLVLYVHAAGIGLCHLQLKSLTCSTRLNFRGNPFVTFSFASKYGLRGLPLWPSRPREVAFWRQRQTQKQLQLHGGRALA